VCLCANSVSDAEQSCKADFNHFLKCLCVQWHGCVPLLVVVVDVCAVAVCVCVCVSVRESASERYESALLK